MLVCVHIHCVKVQSRFCWPFVHLNVTGKLVSIAEKGIGTKGARLALCASMTSSVQRHPRDSFLDIVACKKRNSVYMNNVSRVN